MALASINTPEEKQKKSALEKFAMGLDIAQGIGNVASMGSKMLSGKPKNPLEEFLNKKNGINLPMGERA